MSRGHHASSCFPRRLLALLANPIHPFRAIHTPLSYQNLRARPHDQGLPSASRLLQARPYHSGYLQKKRERCLGHCPPRWPPRLFVLAGRYLYRFASERSRCPKGYPIPIEAANFRSVGGWVVLGGVVSECVACGCNPVTSAPCFTMLVRPSKLHCKNVSTSHVSDLSTTRSSPSVSSWQR